MKNKIIAVVFLLSVVGLLRAGIDDRELVGQGDNYYECSAPTCTVTTRATTLYKVVPSTGNGIDYCVALDTIIPTTGFWIGSVVSGSKVTIPLVYFSTNATAPQNWFDNPRGTRIKNGLFIFNSTSSSVNKCVVYYRQN